MADIFVTRTRNVFSIPTNQTLAAGIKFPVDLFVDDVCRVDWSAMVASYLPANALVSFMLKETSDPSNLQLNEGRVLNFTSYDTVVPSGRTSVGTSAVFKADRNGTHVLVLVMSAYRSGTVAGESIALNSVEMTVQVN